MKYTLHSEPQGSDEWLAGRNTRLNASELVLAAGDSMNGRTRTDEIRKLATGIEPEVGAFTQKLYDEGHRFEALARPLAEQIIGRELYPITVSIAIDGLSRRMGASLDGATDDDSDNFEHKRMNAALRAALAQGIIPVEYHWQMEQGQMINGATRTLFMASEWDDDDNLIEEMHAWYESNPVLRDRIIPIWKQTEADAENYQHVEPAPVAVAAPIKDLPAISVTVTGELTINTNFKIWSKELNDFIKRIPEKPATDQEFADCKAAVAALKKAEEQLDAEEARTLSQVASIDDMKREKQVLFDLSRTTRLALEKLVVARDLAVKQEIMQEGKDAAKQHIDTLNLLLGKPYMPAVPADFASAIRNKRSYASMRSAVSDAIAQFKIDSDAIADRIEINLNYLRENAKEYPFLFADAGQIVLKANDDFEALAKLRITEHKESEAKKLEAIKEAARVEAEANAAAKVKAEQDEAERKRKADEEAAQHAIILPEPANRSPEPAPQPDAQVLQPAMASPCPATAVRAAPDNGRYIRLGEINALLGFTVTAEFLAGLGFIATQDKNARLYRECDVPAICQVIINHVAGAPERMRDMKFKEAA